jgi:hypothetical protein
MNKLLLVLVVFSSISFVLVAGTNAQQGLNVDVQAGYGSGNGSGVEIETQLATQNQGEQTQVQNQVQAQAGTYMNQEGQQMQIQAGSGSEMKLQSGNVEAKTNMMMTQEQVQNKTMLRVKLSNGLNAEVKVMPNTASEVALARLGAKCEGNCTIELKEVGAGNQTRAAYEVKTQKEAKVLGLFKAKMQVQAHVDAENGEVIQTKKPWWAFIATE